MLIPNKESMRLPIGGHQYPSHGIMFRGDTFNELLQKLTDFRITNGIKLGKPEQEILQHYALHWPYMVRHIPGGADEPADDFEQWREWIQRVWAVPPKTVITPTEAKERWVKCLSCPMNKAFNWEDNEESRELERRAFLLRRGVDVPEGLGFCSCYSCDLAVAVFLEDKSGHFKQNKGTEKPGPCWV